MIVVLKTEAQSSVFTVVDKLLLKGNYQEALVLLEEEQPKTIMIRINAGVMPPDHWVNDPEIGGGRIIGEVCHFIDLAMFLAGGEIVSVYANAMNDPCNLNNSVVINLKFKNLFRQFLFILFQQNIPNFFLNGKIFKEILGKKRFA